jgi:hypothetical protein
VKVFDRMSVSGPGRVKTGFSHSLGPKAAVPECLLSRRCSEIADIVVTIVQVTLGSWSRQNGLRPVGPGG